LYRRLVGLQGAEYLAPPGFDPQTVQPVAVRCTDYATPTHTRGAEHVESMCEKSRLSVVDLKERDHLEDRDLEGSITWGLKEI